jgi:hypothetical protein
MGEMWMVNFGAPNIFVTLWFELDYATNPPLGILNDITSSSSYVHLEVLCFFKKTWTKGIESQQVQRSK